MGAPAGLRYEENAASHHRQRLPLAFPGFFVHHTREQTERRRRGVPSHTWVEVMRISRIADQDRKWAQADLSTIGQVWFFLSPGSGIWWNTGRSLVINTTVSTETTLWDRVRATLRGGRRTISPLSATACTSPAQVNMWWARRNAEFRLATCTRARAAGYDSMQLTSSFCGFSFELVDCRGAERIDAEQTWTSACPPTHIQLMSGLPTPRVAPALELASGPAYACLCAGRHSFLNCAARSPARHGPSSPRPAAASAGALAGAVRHYLGLVYPAAKLDDASNEAVLERFNSLHFYYEPLVSRSTILAAATQNLGSSCKAVSSLSCSLSCTLLIGSTT